MTGNAYQQSPQMTVTELGYLWAGLSINDLSARILPTFAKQVRDEELRALYSLAQQTAENLIDSRRAILQAAEYPAPSGFTAADAYADAPRLFTDRFLIDYLRIGAQLGVIFHARSLSLAVRADIRRHTDECVQTSSVLLQRIMDAMLEKGLFWRTPSLPALESPERIRKPSFLNGWFGDKRSLNSMELANLYESLEYLGITEALCLGFAQTAESDEIRRFMKDGREIAHELMGKLGEYLDKEQLPLPPGYAAEVTDATRPVFSDRLAACHIAGMFGAVITQFGRSLGSVMRNDIAAGYLAAITRAGAYTESLTKELIAREWLAKPPGAIERDALTGD